MSQTYDAIIIGAGVMGASLAFHLSERGIKVVILERKTVASGATGHSSGLVRMHYDLQIESQLAFESYKYFSNWRERVGGDCGFIRTGFLQIEPHANEDKLRGNVENQKKLGINTSMISADEVKEIAPDFTTDDFDFAAYEPDSGYADATLTTNSFLEAAKKKSAKLIQDCEVTAIHISNEKVTGVSTTKGDFSAPIVINAAGNWGAQIGKMVGLDIPMVTWTHDVAFLVRPKGLRPFPAFIDDSIAMYGRPEGSSLVLAAMEEDSFRNEEPGAESQKTSPEFMEHLIEKICQRIPKMEESGVHSTHVGRDGLPPDQHAIFGPAGPDGFYLACGLKWHGLQNFADSWLRTDRVDSRRQAQKRGYHALSIQPLRRREVVRRGIWVWKYLEVDSINKLYDLRDFAPAINLDPESGNRLHVHRWNKGIIKIY